MKSSDKKRIDALDASIEELNFVSPEMEYAQIFDRGPEEESLSRYLRHGIKLPTPMWAEFFVSSGGSFDSAGVWGITPEEGVKFENQGIPGSLVGKVLQLTGRADSWEFGLSTLLGLFRLGVIPETYQELSAYNRGFERISVAKAAGIQKLKSVIRYGWMKEKKWEEYLLENSRKIFKADLTSFNGVNCKSSKYFCLLVDLYASEWVDAFDNNLAEKIKNPLFQKWYRGRPSESEMLRRGHNKCTVRTHPAHIKFREKIPAHLIAAAMRKGILSSCHDCNVGIKKNTGICFEESNTSVGKILYGKSIFIHENTFYNGEKRINTTKNIQVKKLSNGLRCCKVDSIYFVWDQENGFKNHIEGDSLKGALKMWQNRSQKGQPRPLCLNDVRNDRAGTAGFCLAGTKAFLEHRMPFVFRMVAEYEQWSEIPDDIMSLEFEVDFKIFEGYRVP